VPLGRFWEGNFSFSGIENVGIWRETFLSSNSKKKEEGAARPTFAAPVFPCDQLIEKYFRTNCFSMSQATSRSLRAGGRKPGTKSGKRVSRNAFPPSPLGYGSSWASILLNLRVPAPAAPRLVRRHQARLRQAKNGFGFPLPQKRIPYLVVPRPLKTLSLQIKKKKRPKQFNLTAVTMVALI